MTTKRPHLVVLSLVVASALRCSEAPSQPPTQQPSATPTPPAPTPTPVPQRPPELSGQWQGTFNRFSCSDEVELTLTQNGNAIWGPLWSRCGGGRLGGTLEGSHLTIQLVFVSEGIRNRLQGTASPTNIDVNTVAAMMR